MNNRNPFIPNIPTGRSHWSDMPILGNNGNSISPQAHPQVPVPLSAHQQIQLQPSGQPIYNVGFTGNPAGFQAIHIQPNSGNMFTEAWTGTGVTNLNMNVGTVNQMPSYSYTLNQQQLQHQSITSNQVQVMQGMVDQGSRGVQLTLQTPRFVPFAVNLSPSSGMVPLTIGSRSTEAHVATASPDQYSSGKDATSMTSMRSLSNSQFISGLSSPLPLDARSLSSNSGSSADSVYVNPVSRPSNVPVISTQITPKLTSSNSNQNSLVSNNHASNVSVLNVNPRLSASSPMSSFSSSSPVYFQRSPPASLSPFSGGSASASPSPTPHSHMSMLPPHHVVPPVSTYACNSNSIAPPAATTPVSFTLSPNERSFQAPANSPSSHQARSLDSRSPVTGMGQYYFSQGSAQVQPPPAHSNSTFPSSSAMDAHLSASPATSNIRYAGRPNVQQQIQNNNPHIINQNQQPPPQVLTPTVAAAPPTKQKKPRAPRKKKEPPQTPVPVSSTHTSFPATTVVPKLTNSSWSSPAMAASTAHCSRTTSSQVHVEHSPMQLLMGMNSTTNSRSCLSQGTVGCAAPASAVDASKSPPSTFNQNTSQQFPNQSPAGPPVSPQRGRSAGRGGAAPRRSPAKANNSNKPSMLDYALEKAGILSNFSHGSSESLENIQPVSIEDSVSVSID